MVYKSLVSFLFLFVFFSASVEAVDGLPLPPISTATLNVSLFGAERFEKNDTSLVLQMNRFVCEDFINRFTVAPFLLNGKNISRRLPTDCRERINEIVIPNYYPHRPFTSR